jgi:hypothetical protein
MKHESHHTVGWAVEYQSEAMFPDEARLKAFRERTGVGTYGVQNHLFPRGSAVLLRPPGGL